jgi:glycosyltransferase involved in cell wall biosynthesis
MINKRLDYEPYDLTIVVTFYKNVDQINIVLDTIVNFISDSKIKIEFILINDSADRSKINVNNIFPYSFKIFELPNNLGVTGARNFGYLNSNSNLILFFDSDDLLLSNCCDRMFNFIIENTADVYFFRCVDENNDIIGEKQNESISSNTPNLLYGKGERIICVRKNKFLPFIEFLRGNEITGLLYYTIKSKGLKFIWSEFPIRIYSNNSNGLSSKINTFNRSIKMAIGHMLSSIFSFFLHDYKWSIRYFFASLYRLFISFVSLIKLINLKN